MYRSNLPAREALENFQQFLAQKTPVEKTFVLMGLFKEVFDKVDSAHFDHGQSAIMHYHLFKNFLFKLSESEVRKVYRTEMTFLKAISSKATFPAFIVRLLSRNYLDNIEGRSREGIPSMEDFELVNHANEIFRSTNGNMDYRRGEIPQSDLEHILRKPFYSIDLKYLILRAEDPYERKELAALINKGLDDEPYKFSKRQRLSEIIEKYIFLSHHFDLKGTILDLEKKSMPIRDKRVFQILEEVTELDANTIHNELKKVFSPFYSPGKNY